MATVLFSTLLVLPQLVGEERDGDEVEAAGEWVVIASILLSLGGHVFTMPQFSLFLQGCSRGQRW